MTYTYYYTVNEKLDSPDDHYEFNTLTKYGKDFWDTYEDLAEYIAEIEWHDNEGHEYTWPVTYYIFNHKHEYIGSYQVHMDLHPSFTAYEFEDKE